MADTGQSTTAPPIRGWLLPVLAILGLWCSWGLIAAVTYLPGWFRQTTEHGPGRGLDHPASVVAGVALLALSFYAFALMLMRKRRARPAMITLCALIVVFVVAIYLFPPHLVRGGPAIIAAAGLGYFLVSKRVKNTFVRD